MHDDEIMKTGEGGDDAVRGIDRRQFLKAGAVLGGGILGGGVFKIADAMASERKNATGAIRVLGCQSDASTGGYFDVSLPPVLRIKSGDIVAIATGAHLTGGMVPGARTEDWNGMYKEEMAMSPDIYFSPDRKRLTGPIHIDGADPGDILQIEILNHPDPSLEKNGQLEADFTRTRVDWHWADLKTNEFGRYADFPFGKPTGRLDGKESISGTVLYVPIRVKGAGVVMGDIHFAQGEVDMSASEAAFRNITLRMTVRKDMKKKADPPFIPTPNHWVALGVHTDLHEERKVAVRKSIRFLNSHYGMPEGGGYAFCSMGAGRHVTQYVQRNAILTHVRAGRGRSCTASP